MIVSCPLYIRIIPSVIRDESASVFYPVERADVINAISFRNFTAPYRVDASVDTEFKTGTKGAHTHVYFIRHSFEPLNELRRRAGPFRQLL